MNNNKIIITPGMRGVCEVKDPYKLEKGVIYEVVGMDLISNMTTLDIKNTVYLSLGRKEEDFYNDIKDNVKICTLADSKGNKKYIPSNQFSSLPVLNGKEYQGLGIAINIGHLPVDEDLTILRKNLSWAIKSSLGIEPSISIAEISAKVNYTFTEFDEHTKKRLALKELNQDFVLQLSEKDKLIDKQKKEIEELKKALKTKL